MIWHSWGCFCSCFVSQCSQKLCWAWLQAFAPVRWAPDMFCLSCVLANYLILQNWGITICIEVSTSCTLCGHTTKGQRKAPSCSSPSIEMLRKKPVVFLWCLEVTVFQIRSHAYSSCLQIIFLSQKSDLPLSAATLDSSRACLKCFFFWNWKAPICN